MVTFCRLLENRTESKTTLKAGLRHRESRRAVSVAPPVGGPTPTAPGQSADGAVAPPAAFAAVRTAPATAPATLSLKTDGMM